MLLCVKKKELMTESTEVKLLKEILAKLGDHDRKFDAINKKFDGIDKKFESIDRRFDLFESTLNSIVGRLDILERDLKDLIHLTTTISEVTGKNQLKLKEHDVFIKKVNQAFAS